MQELLYGIIIRMESLVALERAIVDSAMSEVVQYIMNADFHSADYDGFLDPGPLIHADESRGDYIFRRALIHWHIVNAYWQLAVERGNGGMSDECAALLKVLKELADQGLEVARNPGESQP